MKYLLFIRQNLGLIGTLLAVVFFETLFQGGSFSPEDVYVDPDLTIINEANIVRVSLLALLGYFLVFPRSDRELSFRAAFTTASLLLAASVLWLFLNNPAFLDKLAREDGIVENFSAAFLFLGVLVALLDSIRLVFTRRLLLAGLLALLSVVLLVIGMEEISWMQRILGVESTEMFLEHNNQRGTNLHNFNTVVFENVYYASAFVALVLLPFYRESLAKLFAKSKQLRNLAVLLPSAWLLVPFAVMMGFIKSSSYYTGMFVILAIVLTAFMLIHRAVEDARQRDYHMTVLALISLVTMIAVAFVFALYDYAHFDVRDWVATEYRELLIAIGLFAYTADLHFRLRSLNKNRQIRPTAAKRQRRA